MAQPIMELVYDYLNHLHVHGKADQTITNYGHYLSRFVGFTGNISMDRLTIDNLKDFQQALSETSLSRVTQGYHLTALREFLKYCRRNGVLAPDGAVIEIPRQPEHEAIVLNHEELISLIRQPDIDIALGLRDRAILELLAGSGLRVAELVSLNRVQVNLDTKQFTIRGKGSKLRMVFMTSTSAAWLNKYLEIRDDYNEALFVEIGNNVSSKMRTRLGVRTIQRLVKRYARAAGITKDVTPHTLRHSFATLLLSNGADIRSVQELLGHASILTTQRYTHVTNPQLKSVHNKFLNLEETGKDDD